MVNKIVVTEVIKQQDAKGVKQHIRGSTSIRSEREQLAELKQRRIEEKESIAKQQKAAAVISRGLDD